MSRAVVCFVGCLAVGAVFAAADGPIVNTLYGKIQGKYTSLAKVFYSIPYARPPVDEWRWKDSVPHEPWGGILETVADPPGCPQSMPCDLPLAEYLCPKNVSEDCLFLNVFSPLTAQSDSRLPVMVFFHGGNFIRGYSGSVLYDGQYIANCSNTVIVTVNYRMGAIGFLVYGSGSDAIEGNFGFRDQRLSLQWVQDNIAQFGGDPGQVTIWGQSAGAISVALHMTTVKSSGLFNKAIMESEPFKLTLKGKVDAERLGRDFSKELGCGDNNIQCLYSKNITEIARAQDAVLTKIIDIAHIMEIFLQWTPTIDGTDIIAEPLDMFSKGEAAEIPTIIGTTSEETVFFIYEAFTKSIPPWLYDAAMFAIFNIHYEEVHKQYPPSKGDCRLQGSVLTTDYIFTCSTRYAIQGFVNNTVAPTWMYVFNHSLAISGWGQNFSFCSGFSCHGVELPFVFNTVNVPGFNFTQAELQLSDHMVHYWTNFAHYGDPNGVQGNLLEWPRYDATSQGKCIRFKTPDIDVLTNYQGDVCSLWDRVGYHV